MPSKTAARMEETAAIITAEPTIEERDTAQIVVFTLGNEEYGVGILDVREIVKTGTITMIPNAPDFLKGVINLRSKIVGVIDLEKRFLLKREDEEYTGKHIVIAEIGDGTFGLLVDEVTDVLRLPKEDVKLPPEMITKKIGIDYVKGIGTLGDKLIILLDLARVLSEKELIELAKAPKIEYRKIKRKKKEKAAEEKPVEKPVGQMKETETAKHEVPEEKLSKEKEIIKPEIPKETLPKEEQIKPEKKEKGTAMPKAPKEKLGEKPTD